MVYDDIKININNSTENFKYKAKTAFVECIDWKIIGESMEKDIYKKAIEKWGENAQLDQMIEEMAELTVAINKLKRLKSGEKKLSDDAVYNNLLEEIADVKIMLEEMEFMFGKEKIDEMYEKKMQKFLKQLN